MTKFIVTKEQNDIANTENLRLLCDALGVSKGVVDQLIEFDVDVFNSFSKDDKIVIHTDFISDKAEIMLYTDDSSENYYIVCWLYPNEEGPYWSWVLEYIRVIIVGEMLKRELNYKILDYPSNKQIEVPFPNYT